MTITIEAEINDIINNVNNCLSTLTELMKEGLTPENYVQIMDSRNKLYEHQQKFEALLSQIDTTSV